MGARLLAVPRAARRPGRAWASPTRHGEADAADRNADQLVARRLSAFRVRAHRDHGAARPAVARVVMENWLDEFRYMQKAVDWGVLTYTMHPYVIGRGYRMHALEWLVDKLAKEGAAFPDDGAGRAGGEGTNVRTALILRSIHASPLTCMDASRRTGRPGWCRGLHASRRCAGRPARSMKGESPRSEGVANHTGPKPCVRSVSNRAKRRQGNAQAMAIEPRKKHEPGCRRRRLCGRQHAWARQRERTCDLAWS